MDSTLTKEELACFSELFAKTPSAVKKVPEGPNETVSRQLKYLQL